MRCTGPWQGGGTCSWFSCWMAWWNLASGASRDMLVAAFSAAWATEVLGVLCTRPDSRVSSWGSACSCWPACTPGITESRES